MKRVRKIIVGLAVALLAVVVLLFGSIAIDALMGRNRMNELTNMHLESATAGKVSVYVARPDAPGPHPVVIMIHEFYGLRPDIIAKAEALAAEGYVVVAPDTYRGRTTNWIPRAIYLVIRTAVEQVNTDLDVVFDWLAEQPDVQPDRIAVMGFCYGGGKALQYSLHTDQVASTGIFYGSLVTDADVLRKLPGPVLGIFGAEDQSIPVAEVRAFEAALNEAGVPNQITIYDGVGHAFVSDMETIEAGGAPGAAWAEFLAFLEETLAD